MSLIEEYFTQEETEAKNYVVYIRPIRFEIRFERKK